MRAAYDVVVVGARCAGAATARLLAAAGLDVLLLDRTLLPAEPCRRTRSCSAA
jgi:flavin-dependent dehydrogenase